MNYSFPFYTFEYHLFKLLKVIYFSRAFKKLGDKSFVSPFSYLQNTKSISIGDRSIISKYTLLQAIKEYSGEKYNPDISIGNDVYVGKGCTISCANKIIIGDKTTIGDYVYIGDGRHGYEDITKGVIEQQLVVGEIVIGKNVWLGYGSFIAGNVEIGENAVIGANSVVTKNVSSYSVVAGSPAKEIKKYDFINKRWMNILKT